MIDRDTATRGFWLHSSCPAETFAAFRSRFEMRQRNSITIESSASGPYTVWIDGEVVQEGPVRAKRGISALASSAIELDEGSHTVAVLCHHEGIATRITPDMPPHLRCALTTATESAAIDLNWRATSLHAYETGVRRINPELGWIDWCDTSQLPVGWRSKDFDDNEWEPVRTIELDGWVVIDGGIGPVSYQMSESICTDEGFLAERYGYEKDDPPARFLLRELTYARVADDLRRLPSQGVWRRYDRGKIALLRPQVEIDVPAGTIVEIAYCEELHEGRVNPFVTLSLGPTCNMDHYVARGGRQWIETSGYRGGRFVEIHLVYPAGAQIPTKPSQAFGGSGLSVRTRTYYPTTAGAITTGDALLDRIWTAGAETLASCSEDAIDDCPTRERGEWLGDVVTVGAAIAGAAFSDLRVFRKALIDAALDARDDGMVAGLCPGTVDHIPSYAATWVEGVVNYIDLTGDTSLARLLFGAIVRNIDALAAFLSPEGMVDSPQSTYRLGWVFVDWGYVPNDGPSDMVLNMHVLNALRSALRIWPLLEHDTSIADESPGTAASLLPKVEPSTEIRTRFETYEAQVTTILRAYLDSCSRTPGVLEWGRLGYHRAVLAMRHGLIPEEAKATVLEAIRTHQDRCFPNDPTAPRNDSPFKSEPRLITPYFYHYAMPLFAEADRMEYVLEQYRSCWGWLLGSEGEYTTLCEVFDRRWSQCHQWSGSPTWQLSRYVLGLSPVFTRGYGTYEFSGRRHALAPSGRIPLPGRVDAVEISTSCTDEFMRLEIDTPIRLTVIGREPDVRSRSLVVMEPGTHTVIGNFTDGTVRRESEER